jgi:hypothetical protein
MLFSLFRIYPEFPSPRKRGRPRQKSKISKKININKRDRRYR